MVLNLWHGTFSAGVKAQERVLYAQKSVGARGIQMLQVVFESYPLGSFAKSRAASRGRRSRTLNYFSPSVEEQRSSIADKHLSIIDAEPRLRRQPVAMQYATGSLRKERPSIRDPQQADKNGERRAWRKTSDLLGGGQNHGCQLTLSRRIAR